MDEYLTPKQAAHYLSTSLRTLERRRLTGYGPPFIKNGRGVLYSRAVIDNWLKSKEYGSTSEYPGGPHSMGWII